MWERARLWSAAVLASVLAHGVLLGVLTLAVDPAPTAPQETPGTRLAISTQTVESQAAQPAAPASERPNTPPPESARMDGAAVPLSRARPAALAASHAPALAPVGTALAPRAEPGPKAEVVGIFAAEIRVPMERGGVVGVAAAPAALWSDPVGPASPVPQPLQPAAAPASVRARPVDAAAAPSLIAAFVALRDGHAAPLVGPESVRIAPVRGAGPGVAQRSRVPTGVTTRAAPATSDAGEIVALSGLSRPARATTPLPETVPAVPDAVLAADVARRASGGEQALDARDPGGALAVTRVPDGLAAPAAQSTPDATRVTAALAWSGAEGGGAVDPVSLAAIQSFLWPSDDGQVESTVRDGISVVLESVPCARLQTAFRAETGQLELHGHIPEEGLRAPVLAALRVQVGQSIPLADNLLVLPRPICGALSGIASVGLAQSREQARDPRIVGPSAHARVYHFVDGDRLSFDLTGPDYPAYFYIDYFDADGMVLHLQPNEIVPLARIGSKERLVVGQDVQGQPVLDIRVSPPFGQEIMVAFATSVPLYDGLRPVREPAGPYLDFLRARVGQARAAHPDFKGEWVYFFVSTRAR